MSRTVSITNPTRNAITAVATAPAYFISIAWSTPSYLTTGPTTPWNGYNWLTEAVTVSGLSWSRDGTQVGTLRIVNNDQRYSALVMVEGVADVAINIWAYDQSATAVGDPLKVFSGVGGRAEFDDDTVTISLRSSKAGVSFSPRTRISPAGGFNHLPPRGTEIPWGSTKYVLEGR
jgi:hypothetical protein